MFASSLEERLPRFPTRAECRRAALALVTPRRVLPLALALLVAFGICDYFTGIEVAFTLLYLVPVCLVTWLCGGNLGLLFAALATASTTFTAISHVARTRPWLVVWNAVGTFGVLVTVVLVLDKLRAYVENERRERRLAVEQLRHAERLNIIGKLAAGVAHELGTPLNVIAGSAELLQSPRLSPERHSALLDTIRGQTARMSRIIRQLLDFGRAAGTSKSRVDLNEIAKPVTDLLVPVAEKRGCSIVFVPREASTVLVANASEIEQVITNLVLNGIQAMPDGGELRVSTGIESRVDAAGAVVSYACVVVEDEGVGIAPADLPRIFDPFFTTKDVGEGTGLGLSISYGIVQDHGGLLEVANRRHGGTSFKALLPLPESSAGATSS